MNGIEIKKRRKELNITQAKLAEMIGVSENTIYNYEKGTTIPQSKITILRQVLYPKTKIDVLLEEEIEYKLNKPQIIAHHNSLLKKVNTLIEKLEAIEEPDLTDLQQLKEAIQLKKDIQTELDSL